MKPIVYKVGSSAYTEGGPCTARTFLVRNLRSSFILQGYFSLLYHDVHKGKFVYRSIIPQKTKRDNGNGNTFLCNCPNPRSKAMRIPEKPARIPIQELFWEKLECCKVTSSAFSGDRGEPAASERKSFFRPTTSNMSPSMYRQIQKGWSYCKA